MIKRIARVFIAVSFMTVGIWVSVGGMSSPAVAQSAVQTSPTPRTTAGGNNSSTIGTGGTTFQKVFSATTYPSGPARYGCEIQNNGAANMWVSEGKTAATATQGTSHVVAAGGTWYCERAGVALQGEIDITGTSTQAFYAVQY